MDALLQQKQIVELTTEMWRLERIKSKKAGLEEAIIAYWKSIKNGHQCTARAPDLIKIRVMDNEYIIYEKLMKKNNKYVLFGIGCVEKKYLNEFYAKLDSVYEKLKNDLSYYELTQ